MNIRLTDTGKRFNRDWIFKHFTFHFQSGKSYVITGPNGSGKSTLLQCIAGSTQQSEGKIEYFITDDMQLQEENIHQQITIVAPYLELIEEMTGVEFLAFHFSFKPILQNISIKDILAEIGMDKAAGKQIRYYSSGMKQRIKLAQAIFANAAIILLDEPCTNLDKTGYDLYHQLINNYCKEKIVIVSSNDVNEYDFCEEKISITDYK
jgi:ABC-type multidrug transport system ATPase subunit